MKYFVRIIIHGMDFIVLTHTKSKVKELIAHCRDGNKISTVKNMVLPIDTVKFKTLFNTGKIEFYKCYNFVKGKLN